ncbi:MAG TPA: nitroreductase family protein [Planctomycetota bacterium]|nr:nitroreductase family protein [Planctomycetota bacterium]
MSQAAGLLSLLRERRSVRRFRDEPVPRALIERLIEAASWAPSASNRQDWRFTVVTSAERKQEMADAVRRRWDAIVAANRDCGLIEEVERYVASFARFAQAPALIVVSARAPDSFQQHLLGEAATATVGSAASAAMAAQNLMLAAHALGLATCCMTGALAARDELRPLVGLGRRDELVCLITLGVPAETPPPPHRRPVAENARFTE